MKEIVLSSTNDAKRKAALQAIFETFGAGNVLRTITAPSGVRATPLSHEECLLGATNRVDFIRSAYPDADYYIGAEGGLNMVGGKWFIGGWVAVENKQKVRHLGSSAWVEMPTFLTESIDADVPLSEVIKPEHFPPDLFQRRETLGTNGLITQGAYSRVNEFYDALRVSLALFNLEEK
jgi:non-canonical (house-cleaning) NTP pyrophosphatase